MGEEVLTINTFCEPNEGLNLVPAWSDPAHHRELGRFREMAVAVLSPQSWAVQQIAQTTGPIPVRLSGMVLEAPRKSQLVPQALLPFWCHSHGAEREQLSSAPDP